MTTPRFHRALLVGCSLLSSTALASPAARITYQRDSGAESCPDETVLRRAVNDRLGYDPFFDPLVRNAEQTIVARITSQAGGLRGEVHLLDETGSVRGSRELRAPSAQCAELVSRMALAISIAVDASKLAHSSMQPGVETHAHVTPEPSEELPKRISTPRDSAAPVGQASSAPTLSGQTSRAI